MRNVYILIGNSIFLRLSNTEFVRIFRPVTFVSFNLLTLSTILLVTCTHVRPLPHCSTVSSEGRCTVESLLMLTEISKSFKLTFWITFLAIPLLVRVGLEVLEHTLICCEELLTLRPCTWYKSLLCVCSLMSF